MNPVATYLSKLAEIRSSGYATNESSYYPAIEALLVEVGKPLKPRVIPTLQLKNRGAGQPDGGLFTKDQFRKGIDPTVVDFAVQPPNRGVIEVKGPAEKLSDTIKSEQVAKYLKAYGQVLLTNYRDFRIVVKAQDGSPLELEAYSIAPSEAIFWAAAAHPVKAATEHGPHLLEFLNRALLSAAVISTPQHLAGFLASYARDALAKVEARSKLRELDEVRAALEEALGLKFTGDKGEHFFRSTLVQTLFYGLFSAWVLWCREPGRKKSERFEWKTAVWSMQVPMIRALYERVAVPGQLEPLGLVKLLDLAGEILSRVDRDAFFQSFEAGTAVQYFYEPFLEAYDPALRKELGVWYTPREIVRYMVERVDTVLRTELNLPSGLADPKVYVLDPACGTGAYLVEVLDRIYRTICEQQGKDALTPQKIKQAARERVFGFEILPAPFVISHLQLGLLLQTYGAPLSPSGSKRERVGVYLTNSLTGWEPPDPTKAKLPFPEFEEEKQEADHVKRDRPILVVLGNPPYNGFAGVSPAEEQGLVEPYKEGLSEVWGIKKYNLDDLYVRFFRLAERRIAEQTSRGVICFISNFSFLSEKSFVVLRSRLLSGFDNLWFDCMNGDSRETGKVTPDGEPDPSVFSTAANPAGIKKGTAVSILVKCQTHSATGKIHYRDFWGAQKRSDLVASLSEQPFGAGYIDANPEKDNYYSFRPSDVESAYRAWPLVTELSSAPLFQGLDEDRANSLIEVDQAPLQHRMQKYFDSSVELKELDGLTPGLTRTSAGFSPDKVRSVALARESYDETKLQRYLFRPFDQRWCYYSTLPSLWKRSRPELGKQIGDNRFLLTRAAGVAKPEGFPFLYTRSLFARDSMRGHAVAFPVKLYFEEAEIGTAQAILPGHQSAPEVTGTLSERAVAYASEISGTPPIPDPTSTVWSHVIAIGFAPAYISENIDGIRENWPRIPLPNSPDALCASSLLGATVAALLDAGESIDQVTTGVISPGLRGIARLEKIDGKPLDPTADLEIRAGWGHPGKDGITMPGRGKFVQRERTKDELASLVGGPAGLTEAAALQLLGPTTFDIYLNDVCAWKNIPEKVWEFYIGGYQVIKKWLSYREFTFLNRPLTIAEATEVTNMARRLTQLCLLQPALDANYQQIKANSYVWPRSATDPASAAAASDAEPE